jgi:hypothetical protein
LWCPKDEQKMDNTKMPARTAIPLNEFSQNGPEASPMAIVPTFVSDTAIPGIEPVAKRSMFRTVTVVIALYVCSFP